MTRMNMKNNIYLLVIIMIVGANGISVIDATDNGRLEDFDLSGLNGQWSLTANIKTNGESGTIVAKALPIENRSCGLWKSGGTKGQGKMLFLRGGMLCFAIGWHWFVCGTKKINDNQWHTVGVRYENEKLILIVDSNTNAGSRTSSGVADNPEHIASFGYSIGHQTCSGDMAKKFRGEIKQIRYNGKEVLEAKTNGRLADFDLSGLNGPFSLTAIIKTNGESGAIVAKAFPIENRSCGLWKSSDTKPGKMLFLRGGKLCFDMGWHAVVCGNKKINDNQWHTVGVRYENEKFILIVDSNTNAGSRTSLGVADNPEHIASFGYSIGHQTCSGDIAKEFRGEIKYIRYNGKEVNTLAIGKLLKDIDL